MRLMSRILCALSCLCIAPALWADTLLLDKVNGYTLDSAGRLQRFQALLVEDGKVLASGSRDAMKAKAADARVVDGAGHTLLPGLIDAHGHVMGLGVAKLQVDLVGTESLQAALARIRSAAAAAPKGKEWMLGRGWNQVIWKLGRFPTAADMDKAVSDRPVWMERVDGHAGWANSAAITQAGIDRDTKDPTGGRIERDAQGNPTGVFIDSAMELISRRIPAMSDAQNRQALTAALDEMASVGLTGVHDAGIDNATFDLYRKFADDGKLSARIYAMIGGTGKDFDAISRNGPLLGYGHDMLTVRSVKLYADGALGSRGAAMLAPYSDDAKNSGLLFSTPEELGSMFDKALGKGYQVCIHAIGDKGNREALDVFAAAYRKDDGYRALRNRIEHAQVVALDDIPRFKELDLIASMQPTHATSDMNMAEDRVGTERIKGAYAWQRFLKQGTHVAGGSDFPVELSNPFLGLHAAVTRQDLLGKPPGGWHADQRMSRIEALRAFTLDAAYAAHQEKTLGTLEPGKWADFILVDQDYFEIEPLQIGRTQVLSTWVAGKQVYQRATSAGVP